MRKKITTIVLICFLTVSNLLGISLDEALQRALRSNPELVAAKELWLAEEAQVPQELSLPDPRLGIGYERIPAGTYSLSEADMKMYTLSQAIPFPSKMLLKSKIATKDALVARAMFQEKQNELIARVKSSYYRLYTIHKTIELTEETKELIQNLAKMAEQQYAVGKAAQHDVLKAQVELSLVIDDLLTLKNEELSTAIAQLNLLLNHPPDSSLGTPQPFEIPTLDLYYKDLEELALEHRPNLHAAQQALERSKQVYTLSKLGYLPDLMVTLKQEEMSMGTETEITRGIMISATIPLWFWKKSSHTNEKNARMKASASSYEVVKNALFLEIQNALADYRASGRRVNLFRTSILPQAEQALKSATIGYQTGKVDFLTLMNSERMLRDAKLKYYRVMEKHGTDLARLEKATGTALVLRGGKND